MRRPPNRKALLAATVLFVAAVAAALALHADGHARAFSPATPAQAGEL